MAATRLADFPDNSDGLLRVHCTGCNSTVTTNCSLCHNPIVNPEAVWSSKTVKDKVKQFGNKPNAAEHGIREKPRDVKYKYRNASIFCVDVSINRQTERSNDVTKTSADVTAQAVSDVSQARNPRQTTSTVNIDNADHVTVQAISIPVQLHVTQAEVQQVKDTAITRAVEDVVVAKVEWGSEQYRKYKEKYRKEKQKGVDNKAWFEDQIRSLEDQLRVERLAGDMELERAEKEGEERIKELSEQLSNALTTSGSDRPSSDKQPGELISILAQRQQSSEKEVAALSERMQRQQREKEEQLAALRQFYEDEKRGEEEKVMRFVLRLEERDQALLRRLAVGMETERLLEVVERLFERHNIRLMGVDCGLAFLMEAPVSRWISVVEQQLAIQETLSQLLPDDVRQSASWSNVASCSEGDVDIRLGGRTTAIEHRVTDTIAPTPQQAKETMTPVPTLTPPRQVQSMPASQRVLLYTPEKVPKSEIGSKPFVNNIVFTGQGTLVIADSDRNPASIISVDLKPPHAVISRYVMPTRSKYHPSLTETVLGLALLNDGMLAVSTTCKELFILSLDGEFTLVSHTTTLKQYRALTGNTDQTLIACGYVYREGPYYFDVITRSGDVVRTVLTSNAYYQLPWATYMCLDTTNNLLISNEFSNSIHVVDLETGAVLEHLSHQELICPNQICMDNAGNMYVASAGDKCVLVRSPSGEWRRLLNAVQHSDTGYDTPYGVCVSARGIVFVAWYGPGIGSLVTGHQFM